MVLADGVCSDPLYTEALKGFDLQVRPDYQLTCRHPLPAARTVTTYGLVIHGKPVCFLPAGHIVCQGLCKCIHPEVRIINVLWLQFHVHS